MKYVIGILCFVLLVLYVDMVFVPDSLVRQKRSAGEMVKFYHNTRHGTPRDNIEIVSVELESTSYYPHGSRTFKVFHKMKDRDKINCMPNIKIDNTGTSAYHFFHWCYYYIKNNL